MKKTVISLLTATAVFAMGLLIGCSNDLHDGGIDVSQADIIGDMDGGGAPLDNESYKFVYKDDMSAWGGGGGTINYKIRPNRTWDGAEVGGTAIVAGDVPSTIEVGDNSGNAVMKGLKSGVEYTLTYVSDGANLVVSVKENIIPEPKYLSLDGYYVLFESSKFAPTFAGLLQNGAKDAEKGTVTYTVSFVPSKDDKDAFVIANNKKLSGTSYKGSAKDAQKTISVRCDDPAPASSDGVALVKYADSKTDDKDKKEGVPAPITHLRKDVETTMTITTKTDGTVTVKVTSGNDFSLNLSEADIAFSNGEYDLTDGAFAFVWYKGIGSWGGIENFAFKVRPNKDWDGTEVTADRYILTNIPNDSIKLSGDDNAILSGLTEGTAYKLSFTPEGRNLRLDVTEIEKVEGLSKAEQDKLEGKWYFVDLDISTSTVDMIVNQNGKGIQSRTIEKVSVKDCLSYVCIDKTVVSDNGYVILSPIQSVSERTDTPTKKAEGGKTRVYVYTNMVGGEGPYLHAWNGDDNFTGGSWPGMKMTPFTE